MPSRFNVGGLYMSDINKGLYDIPNIWDSEFLGTLSKHTPFVVLDIEYYLTKRFLKVLTVDGMIGFIKMFEEGEKVKEFNYNE